MAGFVGSMLSMGIAVVIDEFCLNSGSAMRSRLSKPRTSRANAREALKMLKKLVIEILKEPDLKTRTQRR